MDALERFSWYVDDPQVAGACHEWMGPRSKGYGRFYLPEKQNNVTAHRWLMGHLRGVPLSRSELALHHCDNPPCVNPEHLYVGSFADNMQDMADRHRNPVVEELRTRTHCAKGHEYTEANTLWRPSRDGRGRRACYACQKAATRRWRQKKRAAALE